MTDKFLHSTIDRGSLRGNKKTILTIKLPPPKTLYQGKLKISKPAKSSMTGDMATAGLTTASLTTNPEEMRGRRRRRGPRILIVQHPDPPKSPLQSLLQTLLTSPRAGAIKGVTIRIMTSLVMSLLRARRTQ